MMVVSVGLYYNNEAYKEKNGDSRESNKGKGIWTGKWENKMG